MFSLQTGYSAMLTVVQTVHSMLSDIFNPFLLTINKWEKLLSTFWFTACMYKVHSCCSRLLWKQHKSSQLWLKSFISQHLHYLYDKSRKITSLFINHFSALYEPLKISLSFHWPWVKYMLALIITEAMCQ